MKHALTLADRKATPQRVNDFINAYQQKKYGLVIQNLSYTQIIEMRIAVSNHLHHDTEDDDSKFYNNILHGTESVIGWDGREPIDIEYYQLTQEIQKLLATVGNDV